MNLMARRNVMAKIVSDNLVIRISHKGKETIVDLGRLFNDNPNRVISIVGTVNEDGSPNTAPMSLFYSKDNKTIIAGMVKHSQTVANIKRDGRLIMEVLHEGDIGFGILGLGKIAKEPLECNAAMLAIKIDVSGPRSTPRSERAVEFEKAAMQEISQI
jgi:hypothetical protein